MQELWERYRNPSRGFVSRLRAERWPQGLLVGSGSVGAIVMGHPQKECLMVSHEELFLPLFDRRPVLQMRGMLEELRGLIRRGEYRLASERVVQAAREAGYPEDFVMTDPTHPAFDLLVDSGPCREVTDYLRSVDFATAEASVSFRDHLGARWLERTFVSRADSVIVYELTRDRSFDAAVMLALRPSDKEPWDLGSTSAGSVPKGAFVAHGLRFVDRQAKGDRLALRVAYARSPGGYEAAARVACSGGTLREDGVAIRAVSATRLLVVAALAPVAHMASSRLAELESAVDRVAGDYEGALRRHEALHRDLFERVSLELDDPLGPRKIRPVEELIREAQESGPSPQYTGLLFDACRYNIICSTGVLPPNLQGVWTGTWTPHWSGDYTLDANVQAAVAHYLACGTPELMGSLFTLMDRMMDDFRENARALFGARGIFVNSRVSTTGLQQRYNYCPMYFWTAGGAWLAHYYFDYYLYTQDRGFLQEKALPFMEAAAAFFEDCLVENENGVYEFVPSVSPENHPAGSDSLVSMNATMDVAAVRELLGNLLASCRELGLEHPRAGTWRRMLDRLPEYQANGDGALKEWLTPVLEDNYEHRHMSHLYPLYPGDEADVEQTPELHAMVLRAFRKRMEHYNPREYAGFSLYHVAMAAARAGDAATAWDALANMAAWHVYSGMGTSHNHGPTIFNMDASGGIPAAIVEMLVHSRPGRIRLLPALPPQLGSGMVRGVRCRGGLVIDSLGWDTAAGSVRAVLHARVAQTVSVSVPAAHADVVQMCGGRRVHVTAVAGQFAVSLVPDVPVELRIALGE